MTTPPPLRIAAIQCNPLVGALQHNTDLIKQHITANPEADLIAFPELMLTGYPPEDLLFRPGLYAQVEQALQCIISHSQPEQMIVIGHPVWENGLCYNQLSVIHQREILSHYRKRALPNYTVFDEKRYFTPCNTPTTINCRGQRVGLLICEDFWEDDIVNSAIADGANTLLVCNASPYAIYKQQKRLHRARAICKAHHCDLVYINHVGGQDELVFDGCSFYMNTQATQLAAHCQEATLDITTGQPKTSDTARDNTADLYQVLTLGIRDYVNKNGFPGILLGLSGGVDSALTLALAVDALGAERVHAVMLPSRHTSNMSLEDAKAQAQALGCHYQIIDIERSYQSFVQTLTETQSTAPSGVTVENLQARCRGVLLMALSNQSGNMVLTTGNKSEMAVGYSTLYGDLAGGFSPLKDIYKTKVYELCHYRNGLNPVIPERVLTRAPSAELADNQTDQDTLPDYAVLDELIELIVHEEKTTDEITALGFDKTLVQTITNRIYHNEYKRRQSPVGIRVSSYAFGRDRRYPITQRYQS